MQFVRIPLDRVGVLIGPKGSVKSRLEQLGGHLHIDSDTGEVRIDFSDSLVVMKVENVVRAIGRGFSPARALRLLDDDIYFEVLDIHEYVGKNPRHVKRVSGRVIGEEGKTRRIIEELTGTRVSIYGHTIGIIGELEDVMVAKKALDMLLAGTPHSTVYRLLERAKRDRKIRDLGLSP